MADPKRVDTIAARFTANDGTAVNMAHALNWDPVLQSETTSANDSDLTLTVPVGKQWTIESIRVELITASSTGAGSSTPRQLEVQYRTTGNDVFLSMTPNLTQPPDSTRHYNFSPDMPDSTAVRDTLTVLAPIASVCLPSGFDIRVFDNNVVHATADDMIIHLKVLERDNPTT